MALLLAVAGTFSCSKTDSLLGEDFIPSGQRLNFKTFVTDTLGYEFTLYTKKVDSIPSDEFKNNMLGSLVHPAYGRVDCGFVNMIGRTMFPTDSLFGRPPFHIDSTYLVLSPVTVTGELHDLRRIKMYELDKSLPYPLDSTYYSNFRIEECIPQEPVTTFDYQIGKTSKVKMPNELGLRFISQPEEVYQSDTSFWKTFKGFYFESDKALTGGSITTIDPSSSFFAVYYRNSNPVPDTLAYYLNMTHFMTDPYYGYTYVINKAFLKISRDYGYITPGQGIDMSKVGTEEPQTESYTTSLAGLVTRLGIPKNLITDLQEEIKQKGGRVITVAKATLRMPISDDAIFSMNEALPRLGLYHEYSIFSFVSSYNPNIANQTQFNGTFNRTNRCYEMDLSSYIEALVNGKMPLEDKNLMIEVGPAFSYGNAFGYSTFANTPENPVSITLTYSVMK